MRNRPPRVVPAKAGPVTAGGHLELDMPWRLRGDDKIILLKVKNSIDIISTMRHILLVLFQRGALLEAILQWTERELAGPGRPGTVDSPVVGGALGGAAPSLGRARSPCRARWVH